MEDVRKRFQEPSLLYGEFDAARERGAFEIDSLEIEDLGPANEKTNKYKVTARVNFPYCFEHFIFETEDQAKEEAIKDIKENIQICDEKDIEVSDLNVENLGPCDPDGC